MKNWILKAIIQKIIAFLPFKNRINLFFQKYITKKIVISDQFFNDKLNHFNDHIQSYCKFSNGKIPNTVLEIGTGWFPIIPVLFYLYGVDFIQTVDLNLLLSKSNLEETLRRIIRSKNEHELSRHIDYLPERFKRIEYILENLEKYSLSQALSELRINYLIGDILSQKIKENSIELVVSNNTFEHISSSDLKLIMLELKKICKKNGGVMSHFIDMSDHFSHFDSSITIYNFLKFSEKQWKWIDNSIGYQNRLRIYDYRNIYINIEIPIVEEKHRYGDITKLRAVKLDSKYLIHPEKEVAISHSHLVSLINE